MCHNQITARAKCRHYITMPRKWFRLTSISPDKQMISWTHRCIGVPTHVGHLICPRSIFSPKACSRWYARCGQAVWTNFD